MSEPILIPIKASEELPKDLSKRYCVNFKDDTYGDIFGDIDEWGYMLSIYPELIWYKPISEDELLKKELIKFCDYMADNTTPFIVIDNEKFVSDYIKSKLTEK